MKTHFITFLLLVGMSLGISSRLHAQSSYQPGEENLKAREEFQDNKFGIFLHWGLYAMLATGEWTMTNNNLNYKEYAKLAGGFYPSKFDADKWVAAIKASGAKYICLTSRHHDGFSMFDTQYSDFNIVKATPLSGISSRSWQQPVANRESNFISIILILTGRGKIILGDVQDGVQDVRIRKETGKLLSSS